MLQFMIRILQSDSEMNDSDRNIAYEPDESSDDDSGTTFDFKMVTYILQYIQFHTSSLSKLCVLSNILFLLFSTYNNSNTFSCCLEESMLPTDCV